MINFEKYMNKPEDDGYITSKYVDNLQNEIKPEHFIYALMMAEEYQKDGFTLAGFIEELKKAIAHSMPDRNIELVNEISNRYDNVRTYTDIVNKIVNQL